MLNIPMKGKTIQHPSFSFLGKKFMLRLGTSTRTGASRMPIPTQAFSEELLRCVLTPPKGLTALKFLT